MSNNGLSWNPEPHMRWSLHSKYGCWLVEFGSVHVYATIVLSNGQWGKRWHLFEVREGEVLFSFDDGNIDKRTVILTAQASKETHGKYLDAPDGLINYKSPGGEKFYRSVIESWIDRLGKSISTNQQVDIDFVLDKDVDLSIEGNSSIFGIPHQTSWVKIRQGTALWCGKLMMNHSIYYPITTQLWLMGIDNALISSCSSDNLHITEIKNSFTEFCDSFGYIIERKILDICIKEAKRIETIEQESKDLLSEALFKLANIYDNSTLRNNCSDISLSQIHKVFHLVLLANNIEPPSTGSFRHDLNDSIDYLSMRYQVNYIRVNLSPDILTKFEPVPLITFLKMDRKPVALIPKSRFYSSSIYSLIDPSEYGGTTVNQVDFDTLEDYGYMLFPKMAAHRISFSDIFKSSINSVKSEWAGLMWVCIVIGILNIVAPAALFQIFNVVIPDKSYSELFQYVVMIFIATMVIVGLNLSFSISLLRIEGILSAFINMALIDRLISLPVSFFKGYSSGELTARFFCLDEIFRILSGTTIRSILVGTTSVLSFFYLFFIDVHLATVSLGLVASLMTFAIIINLIRLKYVNDSYDLQGKSVGVLFEMLMAITKLRSSSKEEHAFSIWADTAAAQVLKLKHSQKLTTISETFNSFSPMLAMMFFFFILGSGYSKLEPSLFISFYAAFSHIMISCISIISNLGAGLVAIPLYSRLKPILVEAPEEFNEYLEASTIKGAIEVSSLVYRYNRETEPVLNGLSLSISSGEFVAIVGPSGSGKSTLLRILLGFEKPESGSVYYDKSDISNLNLRLLRQQIGVVLQAENLSAGTILSNISGTGNITYEAALEAALMSGMEDDLKQMPMGLHTIITEGATTLSGGQRQRIMIARALARKPKVIIFDEATSALDNITQALVSSNIEKLSVTRLVIAHRLSTIKHADRILYMDNGKIIESGTFDELIEAKGAFSRAARRQIVI